MIEMLRVFSLSLVLSATIGYSFAAWTDPSSVAPDGNPPPPVNVGTATQQKAGNLFLGSGSIFGATTGQFGNIAVATIAATGKVTSAPTLSTDSADTLATKGYVDAKTATTPPPPPSCTPSWTPDPSQICSTQNYTQTDGCGHSRVISGTKNCAPTCTDTTWTPDPGTVCSPNSFTQSSNCSNSRTVVGTKNCALGFMSCTNSYCTGSHTEVIPRNGFGYHGEGSYLTPAVCDGDWWVDTRGGSYNSNCSTTWRFAGNCNYPDGSGVIPGCPIRAGSLITGLDMNNRRCNNGDGSGRCVGENSVVTVSNTAHPTPGTYKCTGTYWVNTADPTFDSYCSTGWVPYP